MPSLDSFGADCRALLTILYPADQAIEPTDADFGDQVDTSRTPNETADIQAFRWVRWVDANPVWGLNLHGTLDEAIDSFTELDAQARLVAPVDPTRTFADLDTPDQQTIVDGLLAGTLPLVTSAYTEAEFAAVFYQLCHTFEVFYWSNWPNHQVRNNLMQSGTDKPAFQEVFNSVQYAGPKSSAPDQISCPRTNGSGSAYNYTNWFIPVVKSVEDQSYLAMVEVTVAGQISLSEDALVGTTGLITEEAFNAVSPLYLRDA